MVRHYTDYELMTWRPAKNVGGATIGPREVCRISTGGNSLESSIVAVTQPDGTDGVFAVNGRHSIIPGSFGHVCFGPVVLVSYDTGTPAVGEQFGWKSGQGTVSKDEHPLFDVLRVVDSENCLLLGSVIGGTSEARWGVLDADLTFDDAVGVTFSIWELNGDNYWDDTGENIENVLPPLELCHAMVPAGLPVSIEQRDGKWYVCEFPKHYQGVLYADLEVAADNGAVLVPDEYGDLFTDCKALASQSETIPAETLVELTLYCDGYYYVSRAEQEVLTHWGVLDADLAYNNSTGVTFSIWKASAGVWGDTTKNIENVLPPANLKHAMIPSGTFVTVAHQVAPYTDKWFVVDFPQHYEGVLAGDLSPGGTATVSVGGDLFTDCKALALQPASIKSGVKVRLTLMSDGYYYVDLPLETAYWGKLDADLAFDDDEGVTFSIWELSGGNAWSDSTENIANVLPPFELKHALVPSGNMVKVERRNDKWFVTEFPKHYQGVLQGDLEVSGTATVYVPDQYGDTFAGCKALEVQTETIDEGSDVRITLMSDGYYYVDLAPC